MLQLYSDNITVAAGGAVPFNNVSFAKGCGESLSAPATVSLNKKGVYLVRCDAYGTVADAGDFSIQIYVNGVPRLDAINESTVAVGDMASVSTEAIIVVEENDCRCNCFTSATNVQVVNPSTVDAEEAHYNLIVNKII